MDKLVSIIIVNHNGQKWLKKCLNSIKSQSYKNIELIMVDNASVDQSIPLSKTLYPEIVIVKSNENLGFAGGNILGYKKSKGKFVLLLNNDTVIEKRFVEKFVKAFEEIPNLGMAQSKMVHMQDPKKIDTCGSFLTSSSFLYHYGNGKNSKLSKYNKPFPVFTVKAASVLISREAIKKVGFFDEDFWSYYEETDLCHRLWNAGYECWYYPKALCYHAGGGTTLEFFKYDYIQFHNFKNKMLSFLKNFELKTLMVFIPKYLVLNFVISIAWLFQGKFKHSLSLYKAIIWNIYNLKKTLAKRELIQKSKTVSDKRIFSMLERNPKIEYYHFLFKDNLRYYID